MKKGCVVLVLLLISAITVFSQDKGMPAGSAKVYNQKAETQRLLKLSQQLEGTYQIQIIDSREMPAIQLGIMDSIVAKRQSTQTIYFWLKNNTRIMVPPVSLISKKDFSPLIRVKHISSKDLTEENSK
jgi:hypothetical protein